MRDLFYMELRDRCEEIRQQEHMGIVSGKGEELAEFVRYVVWLSEMTRSNGLLILEEEVEQANIGVAGEASVRRYFFHMLQLIVDGADSQEIEQICMAEYFSAGMRGYDALQYLIYFAAAHAIQTGVHHRVIEEELAAMLPEPCRSAYERIRKEPYVAPKEKTESQCEEHIYSEGMLSKPDPSEIQARREEIIKSYNERMRSTTKAERMAALESFCGFFKGLYGSLKGDIYRFKDFKITDDFVFDYIDMFVPKKSERAGFRFCPSMFEGIKCGFTNNSFILEIPDNCFTLENGKQVLRTSYDFSFK